MATSHCPCRGPSDCDYVSPRATTALRDLAHARWARLRAQFQFERERISDEKYNALIATSWFLDALEATEPGLLWLGWLLVSGAGHEVATTQPVAWMRKRLSEDGLGRAFWRILVQRDPVEFGRLYTENDLQSLQPLLGHWRREQWIVPLQGPLHDWMVRFRLGSDVSKLITFADLEMHPGVALAIAFEGVQRLQTNTGNLAIDHETTFETFEQHQLPVLLAWIDAVGPGVGTGPRKRGWKRLERHAQR